MTMLRLVVGVLVSGVIAAAPPAAPVASATDGRICSNGGSATICQKRGHIAIDAAPPQVSPPRSYGPYDTPLPFFGD